MAKILVIDDDKAVRFSVRKILESADHLVEEASDGKDGLIRFSEGSFDLVITDLVMPDKDGIETISSIKMSAPETPVIAISGGGRFGGELYLETAKVLGASEVLTKPFSPVELLECVGGCLAKA